jgi:exodeoxyribonuclease-1
MKVEPYNIINPKLLKDRAELILKNRAFAEKISTILREEAEEKQATSSQEDITAEESIYKKFTSNRDNALMPQWHEASWEDKFKLLNKFEDERLVDFGKKIIYQNSDVLPKSEHKKVKRAIAERILSEKKEKWWTVKEFYNECDYHRVKFEKKNDLQKLEFLNELNNYVEGVERKYSNA